MEFALGILAGFAIVALSIGMRMRRFRRGHGRARARGRGPIRWLFRRLDTAPDQEVELRAVLKDLESEVRRFGDALRGSREELALLLRADELDDEALESLKESHAPALARLVETFKAAFERVHETLDPEQRDQLAAWMARGARRGRCGRAQVQAV